MCFLPKFLNLDFVCAIIKLQKWSREVAMSKKGSISTLFRANKVFFVELFKKGKMYLLVQLLAVVLVSATSYLTTYAPKEFLDAIITENSLAKAMLWAIVLALVGFYNQISNFFINFFKRRAICKAKLKSKRKTYEKIETIYLTYFEDPKNITNFNKALSYNETGGEALLTLIVTTCSALVSFGTMAYISTQFEWWLWLLIVALVGIQFVTERYTKKITFAFSMQKMGRERQQNYFNGLPTNKTSLAEIKINSTMDFFFHKYEVSYNDNIVFNEKFDLKLFGLKFLFSLPATLFNVFCYFLIGTRLLDGTSTVGDYTLFFTMVATINGNLKALITNVNSFYEQALSARVYTDFMEDQSISVPQLESAKEIHNGIERIDFRNVSFSYPGRNDCAIRNLDLSIKRGEKIAIIGANGAGKTTFIKMLTLLFHPSAGELYVNGTNVLEIDSTGYWEKISIVFQNHQEFSMSIRENVLLGNCQEDETVLDALRKADLLDKVLSYDKGLDLQLTRQFDEEGVDLSGGERQKLAIARAFAKEADFYIFDEPSSALDPLSEDLILENINSLPKDKTVIMISHRLSSIYMLDRILFFKNGVLIADGSHNELMKTCLEYKQMYELQAKKYSQ